MREIDWIRRYIAPLVDDEEADRLKDDAAMLTLNGTFALSTDMLVEGQHFLAGDPLETVGRKLVRVTVSDLIAKGALPSRAMVSIAWPKNRGEADFAALISGLGADLAYFGMALVGGDTVSTDGPLCLKSCRIGACGRGPSGSSARCPSGGSASGKRSHRCGGAGAGGAKEGDGDGPCRALSRAKPRSREHGALDFRPRLCLSGCVGWTVARRGPFGRGQRCRPGNRFERRPFGGAEQSS